MNVRFSKTITLPEFRHQGTTAAESFAQQFNQGACPARAGLKYHPCLTFFVIFVSRQKVQ